MTKNIQYVSKVGWYILGRKKLTPDQYIHYMALPTTPLDEIGLVLFARMKKIHIAFLMEEKYWTTQRNHEFKKCTIVLAFRGNLTFNDTRKRQPVLPKPAPASVKLQYELRSRQSSRDKCPPPAIPQLRSHCKDTLKTPPGKVVISTHGIPKKQVQHRVIKCHLCRSTADSERNLRIHYQEAHKGFSFHCQYCMKKCSSRNNLRRHENSHQTFQHECNICKKRFQYPGGLKTHVKIHTRKNLIPCLHCRLKFTTNKAMKNHAKKHTAPWIKCDYCSESFDTTYNKKQHERGAHGDGWKAPCGQKCKWPGKLRSHKRCCTNCQDILSKVKLKRDKLAARIAANRNKK